MSKQIFYTRTEAERQAAMAAFDDDRHYEVTVKLITPEQYRSGQQNNAMHKGFALAAERCNLAGITRAEVYSRAATHEEFSCVQPEDVKNVMREVARHLTGDPETKKIPPDKVGDAWDLLSLAFSQRLFVDIGPLPSIEEQRIRSMADE